MRYSDLGCRYRNVPHELEIVNETPRTKWEVCHICNRKFRFNKGYKKRVDNLAYLKAHVREFAQPNGATKRIYNRIYKPETTKIVI